MNSSRPPGLERQKQSMKVTKSYIRYQQSKFLSDALSIGLIVLVGIPFMGLEDQTPNQYFFPLFLSLSLAAWFIASFFSRLYADRRTNKFAEEIISTIYNAVLFAILLAAFLYFFMKQVVFNNLFFLSYTSAIFLVTVVFKYVIRKYTHRLVYAGKFSENFLLVGATPAGVDFLDTVHKYGYYGYHCGGVLHHSPVQLNGSKYFGAVEALDQVLSENDFDEVVIALPNSQPEAVKKAVQVCDQYAIPVKIIPDIDQYATTNIQVNNLGLIPVLNFKSLPLDKWENRTLKRSFDIAFSLCFFLLIGSWLMPILMVLIKLSSKGPVMFKQVRWGLNNEKITCYKFRTMVVQSRDVDEQGSYQQATKNDPRITDLGLFLRKTSLDELPQFYNVLRGDMSVVGPRPHPIPLNMASIDTVDNYMLRHMVKPGITGWAQVNGCRGETKSISSMQKRVNYDLYYIHRWSFWFDCQVVLQTIINIFRGDQNAY